MRIILFGLLTILLVSCSHADNTIQSGDNVGSINKESFDCMKGSKPIFDTSGNIVVGCTPPLELEVSSSSGSTNSGLVLKDNCTATGELVSGETCYRSTSLNTINLSDIEAKKISMQLFRKREDRLYFNEGHNYYTGISMGVWTARYNRPDYPNGLDSLTVASTTKKYAFTGVVYTREDRDVYLGMIEQGYCRLEGEELEQYKAENSFVKIGDGYYKSPDSDCSMRNRFASFTSMSPDGRYITYDIGGYEYFSTMILDVITGKKYNITDWSSVYKNGENLGMVTNASNIIWNNESTRFTYITPGFYCLAEKGGDIFSDIRCQKRSSYDDGTMIYDAGSYYGIDILGNQMMKFRLRVFDGDTFEEIYSRDIEVM